MTKRHALLNEISQAVRGMSVTETKEIMGKRWTLKILDPRDDDWVWRKTRCDDADSWATATFRFSQLSQKPRIACALVAIDDVQLADLFTPDDNVQRDEVAMKEWRRCEALSFLEDTDVSLISELHKFYSEVNEKHLKIVQGARNLAERTPSNA